MPAKWPLSVASSPGMGSGSNNVTITFDITPQAARHSHFKITYRNVRRLGRYNDRNDEHLFLTILLGALAGDLDAVTITRCETEPHPS